MPGQSRHLRSAGAALLALAAACGSSAKPASSPTATPDTEPAASPAASASETVQVTLPDVGLEATSLDRSADPCADFFQYACGGWIKSHPIPADKARYGRFGEVDEHNEAALHAILEEARTGKGNDPVMTKIGAFYGSCMDTAAVEKAGVSGIKPLLDAIAKVKDPKSFDAALLALHKHGVYAVFDVAGQSDFKDSTTYALYLDTGPGQALGLPDRDYYLKDDFKDKRAAYREHLVRVFGLLGKKGKAAATAADDVLAVETQLAKLTKTGVDRRDVPSMYHATDLAGLAKESPGFPWEAHLKALGAPASKIVMTTPEHVAGFAKLRTSVKPAQWQSYLTATVIAATSGWLPKALDDEGFALDRIVTGVETQPERWKRCAKSTEDALPELVGQPFVARMFPGASKEKAITLVKAIADAMGAQLTKLPWMSEKTRAAARSKLAKIDRLIGFPDTWREYDFAISPTNYAANALAGRAFEAHRVVVRAGQPVNRKEWLMGAFVVNAYYDPTINNTALPAGILSPPFFGADRSIAANLGGIGMVVGHELTHGFDDQGAQFDEVGNLNNWWQAEDLKAFQTKGQCVADQYSTFEALPGKRVNGKLTLGENIADLGGVKMAFNAYRNLRAGAAKTFVADGFTEDQQFFLGVGQAWCSQDREAEIERRLTVDPHAPPRFRVYGALRNLPAFAEAFQCKSGTPMAPKDRCEIW